MAGMTNETRALRFVEAFERKGKIVRRVVIEGKRVELELAPKVDGRDDFDMVDMRDD